jgi:hypothetical protein
MRDFRASPRRHAGVGACVAVADRMLAGFAPVKRATARSRERGT